MNQRPPGQKNRGESVNGETIVKLEGATELGARHLLDPERVHADFISVRDPPCRIPGSDWAIADLFTEVNF